MSTVSGHNVHGAESVLCVFCHHCIHKASIRPNYKSLSLFRPYYTTQAIADTQELRVTLHYIHVFELATYMFSLDIALNSPKGCEKSMTYLWTLPA